MAHHVPGWPRPQQTNLPRHEGEIIWQGGAPKQRFGNTRTEYVGYRDDFVRGVQRTGAHEDRYLLSPIENLGRTSQIGFRRHQG
jgi:hypothetical protein